MKTVYYVFLVSSGGGLLMAGKHQTFKTASEHRKEISAAIIVKGVDDV